MYLVRIERKDLYSNTLSNGHYIGFSVAWWRDGAGMTGSTAAHIRLLNFRNHINMVSFDFLENTKDSLILNDQQRPKSIKVSLVRYSTM